MKKRAEITFESEETIILNQDELPMREYCPRCQTSVNLFTPRVVSLITGASEREIFRHVEADAIYFIEVDRLAACLGCYLRIARRSKEEDTTIDNRYLKSE